MGSNINQGRRKGGAEGANAPSIFGKLHNLSQFWRKLKNLQQLLLFENILHRQFSTVHCVAPVRMNVRF